MQMAKYVANTTSCENPPHVYAIGNYCIRHLFIISFLIQFHNLLTFLANEALKNVKIFKKSQSILMTGVTGSGKTETGKHIIEFLSQATNSQDLFNSSSILEAFGNARTRGNENSSRFCKHIEVISLLIFATQNILCVFQE